MLYMRCAESVSFCGGGPGTFQPFRFDFPSHLWCVGFVLKGVKPSMVSDISVRFNGAEVLSFSGSWSDEEGREVSAGELVMAHAQLMGLTDPMGRVVVMFSAAPGLVDRVRPGSCGVHVAELRVGIKDAPADEITKVMVDFLAVR